MKLRKSNPFVIFSLVALAITQSRASVIWKAGDDDNLSALTSWWTTETGTTNPVAIGTTDTLWFGGSGQGTSRSLPLGADLAVGALRLDNSTGTPNYSMIINAGNTLTLNGNTDYTSAPIQGIVLNSASGGTMTVNCPIVLGATQRWVASRNLTVGGTVNLGANTLTLHVAAGTTTISGAISGTGGITRDYNAGGTALLTGTNNYSGSTILNLGVLRVTGSGVLGGATGSTADAKNIVFGSSNSNAALEFETAANLGAADQVRFRNTGGTAGSGGTLRFIGTTAQSVSKTFQCDSSIGIRLESNSVGGALTFNGAFSQTNRPLYLGGTGTGDNTLATGYTGTGGITKNGTGKWILSGTHTYTGATTVAAGWLALNGTLTSPITVSAGKLSGTGSTTKLLTTAAGTTLALPGGAVTTSLAATGVTLSGTTTVTFDTTPTLGTVYDIFTYGTGTVTNPANLYIPYHGTITDDAADKKYTFTAGAPATRTWNTTTGNWDLGTSTSWAEGDQKFFNGDTVIFNDPASDSVVTLTGSLSPAAITVSNTNAYTFSGTGALIGTGALAKSGTGTLTISNSGTNSYSGGVNLSGGRLNLNCATALGATAGALTISGTSVLDNSGTGALTLTTNNAQNWNADFEFAGTNSLNLGTGAVTLGGDRQVTVDLGTLTVGGAIGGSFALTKSGGGTLLLAAAGSYTGATTVNNGTLKCTGSGAVETSTGISINTSGTFEWGRDANVTRDISGTGTITRSTTTGNAFFSGNNSTFAGNWNITSGYVGLTNDASVGVASVGMTLNGGGIYFGTTGQTLAASRTITLGAAGGILNGATGHTCTFAAKFTGVGALTKVSGEKAILTAVNDFTGNITNISGGGTLEIGGAGQFGNGSYAGTVAIASGNTFSINTTASQSLGGIISGAGNLAKNNTGTLALTAANTYTGTTTINGGTLTLGTGASLYTTGAFFGGAGTTNVFVNSGGTLETRNWGYGDGGAFDQMRNNSYALRINGGTVRFTENIAALRSFQVAANGATLEAASGVTFIKMAGTVASDNIIQGVTGGTITLTGAGNGEIQDGIGTYGTWSLTAGIIMNGTGTWTLSGVNTYTGDTVVNSGILAVNGSSIADTNNLIINAGKVAPTGTEIVNTLYFGTVQQAAGTWGATGSGATHIDNIHFSGTAGVVSVTTGAVASYATWIAGFSVGGQTAIDQDPDGDGIPNGIEFVLAGGDPATPGTTQLPTATEDADNIIFTFQRDDRAKDPSAGIIVTVEASTDLATWPQSFTIANDTASSSLGVVISNDTDANPDTVTVTIPKNGATMKCARLKVVGTP